MKAETTRRPRRPARASALRMKCTRQRCHVACSTGSCHAAPSSQKTASVSSSPSSKAYDGTMTSAELMVMDAMRERPPFSLTAMLSLIHFNSDASASVTCSYPRWHRDTNDTKTIANRWPETLGRYGRDVWWPELS
jgi:hypothetical protein